MADSFKRVITLTKRNVKEIVRDPLSLVFTIVTPLFLEVLFYFLFHGQTDQFDMKYLAPGIVAFSHSFITLFAGLLLALDRSTSFLTRLYVSKARPHEFIFSYVLAVLPISLIQASLFFLVGGIIDNSIFSVRIIYAILISLISAFFFTSVGILLGSICNEKAIGGVASIFIAGQSVLSGMWFPINGLDPVMVKIMEALPFRNATLLIQNTVKGINDIFTDFFKPMLIVLAYTAAFTVLAILAFRHKMKSN